MEKATMEREVATAASCTSRAISALRCCCCFYLVLPDLPLLLLVVVAEVISGYIILCLPFLYVLMFALFDHMLWNQSFLLMILDIVIY
ncbi:hypothetical protein HN51_059328 [Arachis hypogaea]